MSLDDDTPVHRIGGSEIPNLRLKPAEEELEPPGISVLIGGEPGEAAEQMRTVFPGSTKLHALSRTIATSAPTLIRQAGFDIMEKATRKFPNHGRVIHEDGTMGFNDANLADLSDAFVDTHGH